MAYNLRQRVFREELLETQYEETDFGGEMSDNEEDNASDYEHDPDADLTDTEQEEDELDDELEDVPPTKRMLLREEEDDELHSMPLADRLQSCRRSRGRPQSKLFGKGGKGGKDKFIWSVNPSTRQSDRLNITLPDYTPGPIGDAADCENIYQFWSVLFNDEIIHIIVESTNDKIEKVSADLIARGINFQSYHRHTDSNEIKAVFAILYHSGMWKTHRVDAEKLWSYGNGVTFYRCMMPFKRFNFLTSCLRFDIKEQRNTEDKLSPIRKIWDIFISNCTSNYNPSNMCTVDEQLHGFRGRCKHRVYMKSKPDKYGLMSKTLNDAVTSYLIFAIPYLGKTHGLSNAESVPEFFFREVTTPIHGSNRTVTIDNWFTTIPLLLKMLEDPYKLTITGTIRRNKREIPPEMKVASKVVPDSKFCFTDKMALVSFTPKKNRIVLLVSTFMLSNEVTHDKPNIVRHYNATKGGTDTYDQLCHSFTVARRTKRWPLRFFFGMLDQAVVNARILLKCKMQKEGKSVKITAQQCLDELIVQLAKPTLEERMTIVNLRKEIRFAVAAMLNANMEPNEENRLELVVLEKKARCSMCKQAKDRKTRFCCCVCKRPMCNDHRSALCCECVSFE